MAQSPINISNINISSLKDPKFFSEVSNHYPEEIVSEQYRFRCVRFLVKTQSSLSGSVQELQAQVNKAINDAAAIAGSDAPVPKNSQQNLSDNVKKLTKADTVYGFALPLPNELTDSQSHQWETTKGAIGDIMGGLSTAEVGVGAFKRSASSAIGEFASSSGLRKPLIDPGYFQDYNGTEPRSFTFTWDLIPNNVVEAQNIIDILYNLKKYTLPKSQANGVLLTSPYMFDLEIGNPVISQLMNMNNVVCTNMEIQYAAEGALQFLADGVPKYSRLTMSFTERSTVTSNFYGG